MLCVQVEIRKANPREGDFEEGGGWKREGHSPREPVRDAKIFVISGNCTDHAATDGADDGYSLV